MDSAGNVFVADSVREEVFRIDAGTQQTSVVAGTENHLGFSGDGGLAVNALLNSPNGVAVDSADNLYIADQANNRIRKVDHQTGIITTVAGSESICTDYSFCSGNNQLATSAHLNGPTAVAVDSAGNLYISDTTNNAVRKVDSSTKVITALAGNGVGPTLHNPAGLCLNLFGNLYIADSQNNVIRKIVLSSGEASIVAGTGTAGFSGDRGAATSAQLRAPYDVRTDAAGNLYIADFGNNRIRFVNTKSGVISTIAGSSSTGGDMADGVNALGASLNGPIGVALDREKNVYLADAANGAIRRVIMTGGPVVPNKTSFDFGTHIVGSSSESQTITLINTGGTAMSVSSVGFSSPEFTSTANTCGSPLAFQSSCSVIVVFTPQPGRAGVTEGALVYSDSAGDAPQSVTLVGTRTSGQADISPLTFGNVVLNSAPLTGTLTLTNSANSTLYLDGATLVSGNTALFSLGSTTCSSQVSAGTSCTLEIQFSPSVLGTQTVVVNAVTSASVDPQRISVTATVVGVPQAIVGVNALDFGGLSLNTASAQQGVSLRNSGTATLNINNVSLSGTNAGDFSVVNPCGTTVNPGGSCSFAVSFRPTGVGVRSALLSIGTNAGNSPQAVMLTGQGVGAAGAAIDKTRLSFSYQNLGTVSASQNVTLANPGNVPLGVSSVVLSGANAGDFSIKNGCGSTVSPGTSCAIFVGFTPSANGNRSASLVINTAVGPQTVALSGVGSGNYSVPGCTVLSFVAGPNPIYTNNPFGITSINANVTCPYEIRIGSPGGPLFATGNGYSSTLTGNWVTSGLSFFLQQSGNATPSGTLANLTVQVKTGQGCIATAFTASPNPIVTNNPYGKTTITAATNCSFDVRIGAPDGPEFQEGRGYSVLQTGDWVTNQMTMYLQPHGSTSAANTLSVLTLLVQPAVMGCTVTDFSAADNPIVTTTRLNVATIRANASCPYDVRIGGPGGAVLGSATGEVSLQTGNWVVNGLSFYMQQRGVTAAAGTMATFTINTRLPDQVAPTCTITKFAADPNPLAAPGGSTNVSVNAACAWDLRLGDAAGQVLATGKGAGSVTGVSVADGTLLYLQPQGNADWQRNLAMLRISASAQPAACTALIFSSTPIVADAAFGVTTITADATCPYDIRINSPDGALFGSAQGLFSANTGNWVIFGQVFYLQRRGDITAAGTLATNAAIIIP